MTKTPKVALVTGAAGDIGQAVCGRLGESGLAVVGWDISAKPASAPVIAWEQVDLSTDDIPPEIVGTLEGIGELCAVFHIVGGADADELAQGDPARIPMGIFRRTVELNLFSAYLVLRTTVPLMRTVSGDRSYTFASSTNAFGGYGAPAYSSSKAGLHGLVRALAAPLGKDGIRINAVALGTTRTANYARISAQLGRTADFDRLGRTVPRGRVLSPAEAAAALVGVGICNPALSGAVVVADAGQSITHG
jgi:NAD(P)-dependent dehydrogenase (short-subunit alcohol dehydrogenase family)